MIIKKRNPIIVGFKGNRYVKYIKRIIQCIINIELNTEIFENKASQKHTEGLSTDNRLREPKDIADIIPFLFLPDSC